MILLATLWQENQQACLYLETLTKEQQWVPLLALQPFFQKSFLEWVLFWVIQRQTLKLKMLKI